MWIEVTDGGPGNPGKPTWINLNAVICITFEKRAFGFMDDIQVTGSRSVTTM